MQDPLGPQIHPKSPDALLLHVLQAAGASMGAGNHVAAQQKMAGFFAGLHRYQTSFLRRVALPFKVAGAWGPVRLLSFPVPRARARIVLIPSLINGWEIFDLTKGQSFIAHLQSKGVSVMVVDFGTLTQDPDLRTLDDLILGYLVPVLQTAIKGKGPPVTLLGYCMGGLLLAGAAAHLSTPAARHIFLATPWDIEAEDPVFTQLVRSFMPSVAPILAGAATLAAGHMQALFAMLDPHDAAQKFARFAGLRMDDPVADLFVLTENWLQSGGDLPAPLVAQVLQQWYGENALAHGKWRVGGKKISARGLAEVPSLVVAAGRDRLVEKAVAMALYDALEKSRGQVDLLSPDVGHIGLMASARAHTAVWNPIADWILTIHEER